MSAQWFECVCQFLQSQTGQIASAIQSLGNQNTLTDIDAGDQLQVPDAGSIIPTASPMTYFMMILMMMWAYMFIFSRNAKAASEKPARRPSPEDDKGGNGGGNNGGNEPGTVN